MTPGGSGTMHGGQVLGGCPSPRREPCLNETLQDGLGTWSGWGQGAVVTQGPWGGRVQVEEGWGP